MSTRIYELRNSKVQKKKRVEHFVKSHKETIDKFIKIKKGIRIFFE